ncbi:MAG: hypothetical protein EOM24_20320 [Chloroflexia bacterium]|nr:hypothetical protein [Chloroflexia bacterium]
MYLMGHHPEALPRCVPATPEKTFEGIIQSDAVIRDLNQAKLDALARWVSRMRAYTLIFQDLESGIAQVQEMLIGEAKA